jgi:hypothetical protein
MKDPRSTRRRPVRWLSVSMLAVSLSALAPQAFSQVVLTSGNSIATINAIGPNAGMNSWTVDGVNPLNLQWFWYRSGSMTSERSIDALSAPTITPTSAHQSRISYSDGSFMVSVDYNLNGQSVGSGASTLSETISIQNLTSTAQTFSFFQYSDFNLGGSQGDNVSIGKDIHGLFGNALQTNGPIRLAESSITPGANHAEASIFPGTYSSLTNNSITTLNDTTHAGPGDATWAFEWDISLAAGGSFGISKVLDVQVPEPSIAALIAVGTTLLVVRRRNGGKA